MGVTSQWQMLAKRHHWRVEGIHGQAKGQHGLGRAARRGLANVAIQVYLTAMAMNLKRLAKALSETTWKLLWPSCMTRNGYVFIFHAKMMAV